MNRLSCVLAIILVLYVMLSACLEETGGAGRTAAGDSAAETNTGGVPSSMSPGAAEDTELSYTAGTKISTAESHSGHSYLSTVADQNALRIDTSDFVSITVPAVSKTGDSDGGDKCSFYGLNAAVLVKGGSTTVIAGGTVTSDANGANGVFCYGGNGGQNGASGDGATVMISDTVITTTGDGSGGIMTTGGGVTKATNLNVFTSGQSSAAIRTDRGGGAVTVDGGTYTTNGLGSPAIYSKADISAANASLVSNLSEGVVIEGKNSITLTNVDLTANNTQCYGNAAFLDTVLIYQSMSSDADRGTSRFAMTGGSLTNKNGHVFHVTNTNAVIDLCDVTIVNTDDENILLSVCADGWRGADNIATLNASAQAISGAVLVGSDSTLALTLTDNSSFEGRIGGNIVDASGQTVSTEVGTAIVTLDSGSTWTLTGDSYITSFSGDAENVIGNGYTLYVNGTALCGTG